MNTQNDGLKPLGFLTVAVIALALLLILPTDAGAITFGQWAANQGWSTGYVTPATVNAAYASIDSLAGISNYDWATTPTRSLGLYMNRITSLESGVFTGLGKLTTLKLNDNQITGLESGDFAGLANLTYLALDDNDITNIESGTFTGLGKLTDLELYGNQITSIESGTFVGLENLTTLKLNYNQITSVQSGDFAGLDSLTGLHLPYNQITSAESGAFAGLGSLKYLDLSYNTSLTNLNLEGADFSSLGQFDVASNTGIARVSLKNAALTQTALRSLVSGGAESPAYDTGIGELPGVTELDLSGIDFAAITDLSPLYLMDNLTDLWLVDVLNMDANALNILLDNLAAMQNPNIEGALYLTQADFNAFNTAGGGKLAVWAADAGHRVEIIDLGDANADGLVDDADATILASHWHQMGGANWSDGDFNGDGAVDDRDASILAAHWGEGEEGNTPNVPEPGVFVLLAGLAAMGAVRVRRRMP